MLSHSYDRHSLEFVSWAMVFLSSQFRVEIGGIVSDWANSERCKRFVGE
jgi:hypothetical protein